MAKTLGENRVRIDFNVTFNDDVAKIKKQTADLINLCETVKQQDPRLIALAQTYYEIAAMFAVKAATALPDAK